VAVFNAMRSEILDLSLAENILLQGR